jgi:hypothetical protein
MFNCLLLDILLLAESPEQPQLRYSVEGSIHVPMTLELFWEIPKKPNMHAFVFEE